MGIQSLFGRISRKLQSKPQEAREEVVHALRAVPVFSDLSDRTLRRFADLVHVRAYQREEVIYVERDPGLGLYVIEAGQGRLLNEQMDGSVEEVGFVGPGELVGAAALFGEVRRTETVQAVSEMRLLGFYRPDLGTLMKRNPRAASEVILAIGRHLALGETPHSTGNGVA